MYSAPAACALARAADRLGSGTRASSSTDAWLFTDSRPPCPRPVPLAQVANLVFSCFFTIEAVVKLHGLRMDYFANSWNRFDFFVVALTDIGIVVEYGVGEGGALRSLGTVRHAPVTHP